MVVSSELDRFYSHRCVALPDDELFQTLRPFRSRAAADEWTLSGDLAALEGGGTPEAPTTLAWLGDRDDFLVL